MTDETTGVNRTRRHGANRNRYARATRPPGVAISNSLAVTAFVLRAAVWGSTLFALGLWVCRDADARGSSHPLLWGLSSVLPPFGPAVLLYYFFLRARSDRIGPRRTPATGLDRGLAAWAGAGLVAVAAGGLLAPPDPVTAGVYTSVAFLVCLLPAYLLVYRGGDRGVAAQFRP